MVQVLFSLYYYAGFGGPGSFEPDFVVLLEPVVVDTLANSPWEPCDRFVVAVVQAASCEYFPPPR